MNIEAAVQEKIASVAGLPVIVCGNSDYTVTFTFDSEWDAYDRKTARFVRKQRDRIVYDDVEFSGNTVAVPVLYDTAEVAVGVYAGDIHTTTPARIACTRCITDGVPVHDDPPPDVYEQLLSYLTSIGGGGTSAGQLMINIAGVSGGEAGQAAETA